MCIKKQTIDGGTGGDMRKIVNRSNQKVTSWFGMRKGFKLFHKGVDLRTWTDDFKKKLIVVLPEDAVFIRSVYQKKWGWTHVFKGLESGYTLKFTHLEERAFIKGHEYNEGFAVGNTIVTTYMKKKKLGAHLHFEVWNKLFMNPIKYFKKMEVSYG